MIRDLTRKIEKETYLIRTPIIATMSDEDLSTVGVFVYDDEDEDYGKTNHNEFIVVGKTILQMSEIHSNGYPMYLINSEDSRIIYEILNEYIYNSNKQSSYSPNVIYNTSDTEVLTRLDNLAQDMFDINKEDVLPEDKGFQPFGYKNTEFMDKYKHKKNDGLDYIRERYQPGKSINITDLLKNKHGE